MTVLGTVGRMIWVVIAFALAVLAASAVLTSLGLERATQAIHGRGDDSLLAVIELLRQAVRLGAGLTVIPALLVVIVGEVARIRSLVYYLVGGGLALAVVPVLVRYGQTSSVALPPQLVWQVFATAGFAGGFVYWLLAGRRA